MNAPKYLGIWMDHSKAHLIEFTTDPAGSRTITSSFTHDVKEQSLGKSEALMHNKEQHQQKQYYNELADVIKNYTGVILFGPTEAKAELFNVLRNDHRFEKINIEVHQTDKMTEGQQHAYVKEHFSKS
jgi:hypothetical protein